VGGRSALSQLLNPVPPPSVSAPLAAFIAAARYEQLPARTIQMTKRCVLDAIGVSLAASGMGEGCRSFIDLALEQGGHERCTLIGFEQRVPVEAAALANGALAHAMDFEDAHDGTLLHPNAATIPAALAVAEHSGPVSGEQFITAIAVGCEVAVRLARAMRVSPSDFGWYPPPIFGAFGALAASAQLLRLNSRQVLDGLSLLLCQLGCSGEIKYSPDSVIRAVRDAFASRAGVTAALLAARGVRGFDLPLEGRGGFYATFARGAFEPKFLLEQLGATFEIEHISFKPWPCCRGTHAAIEAMIHLRNTRSLRADSVMEITLSGSRIHRMLDEPHASKRRPATAIDAKFSLPFTTAVALIRGRVGLEDFIPEVLQDPQILELGNKVRLSIDASLAEHDMALAVTVLTKDGTHLTHHVIAPLGNPDNPISDGALIEKFIHCAHYAARPVSATQARVLSDRLLNLEQVSDIGLQLGPLLRGST
jgi:2-methylcitrate dehydratase PrpD